MALRDRLNESLKKAMKARDARRVSTLRLVFAAIQDREIRSAVRAVIAETGAAGPRDMGKVMAGLKQRHAGTIDMGKAGGIAKELLASTKA